MQGERAVARRLVPPADRGEIAVKAAARAEGAEVDRGAAESLLGDGHAGVEAALGAKPVVEAK